MPPDTNAQSQCQGSILYVDAFDSFSNNIVALLETALKVHVTIIPSNAPIADISRFLACFEAVVLGPGPGDPTKSNDIELFHRILEVHEDDETPVLGICLGFQSICVTFGATLERLTNPKHGMVTEIHHDLESILNTSAASFEATQYHSLRVKIGHPMEIARPILHPIELWDYHQLYRKTKTCPNLVSLAWDVEDPANGGVLMAVQHTYKPFWGIQFHPESICTSHLAVGMIKRWWQKALKHNLDSNKHNTEEGMAHNTLDGTAIHGLPRNLSLLRRMAYWQSLPREPTAPPIPVPRGPRKVCTFRVDAGDMTAIELCGSLRSRGYQIIFLESAISRPEVGCYSIIGIVDPGRTKILEYTTGQSIMNLTFAQEKPKSTQLYRPFYLKTGQTIWDFLASYVETRKAVGGSPESPFWGGLMGYLSYESGAMPNQCAEDCVGLGRKRSPDTVFAFIEKSLIFDHEKKCVYIQSIRPGNGAWMKSMKVAVKILVNEHQIRKMQQERPDEYAGLAEDLQKNNPDFLPTDVRNLLQETVDQECLRGFLRPAIIQRPKEKEYRKKVRRCLEYIRAGDSYELCLTDQAQVVIPKQDVDFAWDLYKSLRTKNPAPFAAYLHLCGTTIISSSPERFLSWNRKGTSCQMRPIKGTVKKGPGMTKQQATQILSQDKEQAENLMIVDLIRHDLHGVVGAGNVEVKKLMVVEEYETVYQLVSVIEGNLKDAKPRTRHLDLTAAQPEPPSPPESQEAAPPAAKANPADVDTKTPAPKSTTPAPPFEGYTGIDVLQAALPPGSMTGAPKLSSCAILHKVEGHKPRGPYSGVIGYICAGGGGDFSVLIRCAYRDDDEIVTTKVSKEEPVDGEEIEKIDHEVWRIGAGGAITALSDDRAEWDEMNVKLESTLAAFVVEEPEEEGAEEEAEEEAGEEAEEAAEEEAAEAAEEAAEE